jgi:lipoate-protein ligase B
MTPLRVRDLGRLGYAAALAEQRAAHAAVVAGEERIILILVEHDPVVTLGRRGRRDGVRAPARLERLGIPIVESERGGDVTYHGPGQLVAYPVLRLSDFGFGVRAYVSALEGAALRLLASYGLEGRRDPAMHGVFTAGGKIASVGVHVSRGVTRHGIAVNVDPSAEHWACIDPCGQTGVEAASLRAEVVAAGAAAGATDPAACAMPTVKRRFIAAFAAEFGLAPPAPA